jgi:hypothetical protein
VLADENGLKRLQKSLTIGFAKIQDYSSISLQDSLQRSSPEEVSSYLLAIAKRPGGVDVALRLLGTEFLRGRKAKENLVPEMVSVGKGLLRSINFIEINQESFLSVVVEECLIGPESYDLAKDICGGLAAAILERSKEFDYSNVIKTLFKVQMRGALDGFLANVTLLGESKRHSSGLMALNKAYGFEDKLSQTIDEPILFDWCKLDPGFRYALAGQIVPIFQYEVGSELVGRRHPIGWTPLAERLVRAAPDPVPIMEKFVERLSLVSWVSRSVSGRGRLQLLRQFETCGNSRLSSYINLKIRELEMEVQAFEELELRLHNARDQRFESY